MGKTPRSFFQDKKLMYRQFPHLPKSISLKPDFRIWVGNVTEKNGDQKIAHSLCGSATKPRDSANGKREPSHRTADSQVAGRGRLALSG